MLNSLVLAAQLMGEDKTRSACLDVFYSLFTPIMQFSYVLNFSSLKQCQNFSYEGILRFPNDQNNLFLLCSQDKKLLNCIRFIVLRFPYFVLSKHNTNQKHINSIIVVLLSSHLESLLNENWCICLTEKCTACLHLAVGMNKSTACCGLRHKLGPSQLYYRVENNAAAEPMLAIFTYFFQNMKKLAFLNLLIYHRKGISVQRNL